MISTIVRIPAGEHVDLEGELVVPDGASGLVVFAHGSGSSRNSPRNMRVAEYVRATGRFGTLLFDLLTTEEDATYENRFDISLLADRLGHATDWVKDQDGARQWSLGYFGASTGAAAALVAAAHRDDIRAIVSRGGRPDLAVNALPDVLAPTLLIVGGDDTKVIALNQQAMDRMPITTELVTVLGATHLFQEPGALDEVERYARDWFERYLV